MKSNKIIRYSLIFAVIVVIALITSNVSTGKAFEAKSNDLNKKIDNLNTTITALQSALDDANTKEKNDNTAALTKINNLANNLNNEIQSITKGQSDINTKIMTLQQDVAALKALTSGLVTTSTAK